MAPIKHKTVDSYFNKPHTKNRHFKNLKILNPSKSLIQKIFEEKFSKMAEIKPETETGIQIIDEIPKKTVNSNAQIVSNWSKFKKAIQAVFYFKVEFHFRSLYL